MAERKPDPNAKPKQNFLIIGAVLLAVGLLWTVYEWNPGEMIRPLTDAEKKAAKDEKAFKEAQARAKKNRERR